MKLIEKQNKFDHLTILPHSNYGKKCIFQGSNLRIFNTEYNFETNSRFRETQDYNTELLKRSKNSHELKANNEKLKAAIESANILAHSLRSPLSAVDLIAGKEDLPLSYKNLLQMAFTRMTDIIADIQLLDNANTVTFHPEKIIPNNICKITDSVCKDIQFLYSQDKQINFEYNLINSNIICKVPTKSFKDAIYNLVKNSYEAIEYGGKILITMNVIKSNVEIVIKDNGKGIPAHLIENIGKKRVTYGKKDGTGIGLFQVQKMVKECNGKMNIESTVKKGTRIKLSFPILEII